MSFVWIVDPERTAEVRTFKIGGDHVAQIAIGYDGDTGTTISVLVAISPLPGGGHEYIFCIVDADPGSAEDHRYWDGLETARLFKKSDRQAVLTLVLAATDGLLRRAVFEEVHFTTYLPYLPDKALRKQHAILDIFRRHATRLNPGIIIMAVAFGWRGNRAESIAVLWCLDYLCQRRDDHRHEPQAANPLSREDAP